MVIQFKNSIALIVLSIAITSAIKIHPRIFNGLVSERNQFPFYVFLQNEVKLNKFKSCGACLISVKFVLTAAHCIDGASNVILHFGMHETHNLSESGRKQLVFDRRNFTIHSGYSQLSVVDDVALIEMSQPLTLSESIQPIKIADSFNEADNDDLIVIGNGFGGLIGKVAETLEWIPMNSISFDECKEIYPMIPVAKTMFCARNEENRSVAPGDSGGPMIRKSDNKLVGIGALCHINGTDKGIPQVFTNVAKYKHWIETIIQRSERVHDEPKWLSKLFD